MPSTETFDIYLEKTNVPVGKIKVASGIQVSSGKTTIKLTPSAIKAAFGGNAAFQGYYRYALKFVPKTPTLYNASSKLSSSTFALEELANNVTLNITSSIPSTDTIYTGGDTVTVSWTGSGISGTEMIRLEIWASNSNRKYLGASVPFSKGSHTFTLTKAMKSGTYDISMQINSINYNIFWNKNSPIESITVSPNMSFKFDPNPGTLLPTKVLIGFRLPAMIFSNNFEGPAIEPIWITTGPTGPNDKMRIYFAPKGTQESDMENWFVTERPIGTPVGTGSDSGAIYSYIDLLGGTSKIKSVLAGTYNFVLKPVVNKLDPASKLISKDVVVADSNVTLDMPDVVYPGQTVTLKWTTKMASGA